MSAVRRLTVGRRWISSYSPLTLASFAGRLAVLLGTPEGRRPIRVPGAGEAAFEGRAFGTRSSG